MKILLSWFKFHIGNDVGTVNSMTWNKSPKERPLPTENGYKSISYTQVLLRQPLSKIFFLSLCFKLSPMASSVFLTLWVSLLLLGFASSAKFDELFQPSWALDHFNYNGDILQLKLDNYSGKKNKLHFLPFFFLPFSSISLQCLTLKWISGAGFSSKSKYMFGKVTIQIKLVAGDSAGTVTAYYVSLKLWNKIDNQWNV